MNLKKKLLIIIFLLCISFSYAKDDPIIFVINSSDYYFEFNTQSTIPIYITNNLDEKINGQLSYTISENINQQGVQYSSSNTQSQPFPIEKEF